MAIKKLKVAVKGASTVKRAVKRTVKPKVAPTFPSVVEVGDCCEKCNFFLAETVEQGVCRRFPGTPLITVQGILTVSPSVKNGMWCGEFKKKAP